MRPLVLGLSLLIPACATSLEEIRARVPVQTGDFPRPYQALARCVFDRLDAQTGEAGIPLSPSVSPLLAGLPDFRYHLDDQPSPRRARVIASLPGLPTNVMFEIAAEPTVAGASHVEYRRGAATSDRVDLASWEIVTACGQPG
jgi:hypothetical protein